MRSETASYIAKRVRAWGALWGVADWDDEVRVEFSSRLRSSWGRALPKEGVVRLAVSLEGRYRDLLDEVLCHELAHVAVHRLHRTTVRPHGPEWAALMELAGHPARTQLAPPDGGPISDRPRRTKKRVNRRQYSHHCRRCGWTVVRARARRDWRCRYCVESGRVGELDIVPLARRPGRAGPAEG